MRRTMTKDVCGCCSENMNLTADDAAAQDAIVPSMFLNSLIIFRPKAGWMGWPLFIVYHEWYNYQLCFLTLKREDPLNHDPTFCPSFTQRISIGG